MTTPEKKPIDITSVEQFDEALAKAPGEVLTQFVMDGCEACTEDKPKVDALADGCDVTVLRVDGVKLEQLADRFNIREFPTLLHSKSGAGMKPGSAKETEPEDVVKKLKCARPKK